MSKAKQKNQVIDFQHIKILITGSAAVGKTSFCHLLFQSKYSSEYRSTEVMEAKQAISIVNFSMLKKEETNKKEVVWLKLDPNNQKAHLKTLLNSHVFYQINKENDTKILQECGSTFVDVMDQATMHPEDDSVILQDNPVIFQIDNDNDDRLGDDHDVNDGNSNNDGDGKNGDLDDGDDNDNNVNGGGGSNDNGCSVYTDLEKKILLSEPLPETLTIDRNEAVKFITVIDSGGQPEYIHMLPAINNCPTINFVVLDMTKHLDDPVMIQYKSKHNKKFTDYPLHYSNLDMIGLLMSLTTDSLEQPTKQIPTRTRLSIPNKSFIGFVGTHKDKLEKGNSKERIASLNDRLTSTVEERDCKFAVLSAENGVLFPVDNTTAGDSDSEDCVVKILRQKIEDLMDKMRRPNSIDNQLPITWMILELELQELHQNNGTKYITYEDYKRIASEKASMVPEEIEESLEHFDILGVLLHFEKVEGLCDYVIIDHQWLFDSLAMIMHLSPDDIDFQDHHFKKQFTEKRLLAKSELSIINWTDELIPEYLFNLLIYLKVIATVMLNEMEYYYMPCVLPSKIQYNDKYRFLYSEPLLVQFSSGFLPRGFFCSLVVHLLQKLPTGWDHQLHNTEHFSNLIIFQLPDKSFLRLHDKTSYLEIQIRHFARDLCISYHSKVFPVLSWYFKIVCRKLNFNHDKLQYGFLCHDGKSNDDHISVIKALEFPLPSELECCRKCPHPTKLGEFHKIWFEEVSTVCTTQRQFRTRSKHFARYSLALNVYFVES